MATAQVSFEKKKKETEQLRADTVRKLLEKKSHRAGNTVQIPETLLAHHTCSSVKFGLKTVCHLTA